MRDKIRTIRFKPDSKAFKNVIDQDALEEIRRRDDADKEWLRKVVSAKKRR